MEGGREGRPGKEGRRKQPSLEQDTQPRPLVKRLKTALETDQNLDQTIAYQIEQIRLSCRCEKEARALVLKFQAKCLYSTATSGRMDILASLLKVGT